MILACSLTGSAREARHVQRAVLAVVSVLRLQTASQVAAEVVRQQGRHCVPDQPRGELQLAFRVEDRASKRRTSAIHYAQISNIWSL